MASFKFFFFIVTNLSINLTTTKSQNPNFLFQVCSKYKFSPNTTYQSNLKTLLSTITSKSTNNPNTKYYNTTISTSNTTIYGMFMCRGDIPAHICTNCVQTATQRLSTNAECTVSIAAVMWYDECMVRYSNETFFSRVTVAPGYPGYVLASPTPMIYQASFNRTLFETLNKTADEAAEAGIGENKFATNEADLPMFEKLYCLAQCTPDLSQEQCRSCLDGLINSDLPRCCAGMQGGRVLYPNCNIRFEIYPFFRSNASSSSSAPTPAQPTLYPPSNSAESKKNRSRTIILIVIAVAVAVAAMLFTFFLCLIRRIRARKSYNAILRENLKYIEK